MSFGGLTAAAAGLSAPPVVWIVLLIISAVLGVVAMVRWWEELAPSPPPARKAPAPPSAEEEWSPPGMTTSPQGGGLRDVMKQAEQTRRAVLPLTSQNPPPVARGPENQPSPASTDDLERQARVTAQEAAFYDERRKNFRRSLTQGRRYLDNFTKASGIGVSIGDEYAARQACEAWIQETEEAIQREASSFLNDFAIEEDPKDYQNTLLTVMAGGRENLALRDTMKQRLAALERIINQL